MLRAAACIQGSGFGGEESRAVEIGQGLRDRYGWSAVYADSLDSEPVWLGPESSSVVKRMPIGWAHVGDVLPCALELASRLRRDRVEALLVFKRRTVPVAWMASRLARVPMVFNAANSWPGSGLWCRFAGERVVCISESTERDLIASCPRVAHKTRVIPLGISTPGPGDLDPDVVRDLGLGEGRFVWIVLGRLSAQKRQDIALKAFAIVHRSWPEARLLVVGSGPSRAGLESLASDLGLTSGVCFLGHQEDAHRFLRASDALVQSSDWEGMPNAILEAMAIGRPVVATSAGGTAEVVRHGVSGLVVEPGDEARLAEAMISVMADRALARSFGSAGRKAFEARFTFERMMNDYHRVLAELTQR